MKLAVILALSAYFQSQPFSEKQGIKKLLIPGTMVGFPVLVTIVQPDMGTGMHMLITGASIIFLVGINQLDACLVRLLIDCTFYLVGI
jgi:rod shape determining protein RodA